MTCRGRDASERLRVEEDNRQPVMVQLATELKCSDLVMLTMLKEI